MKLSVTLGERRFVVDLPDQRGQPPSVDGAPVEADIVQIRTGLYSLLVGGRSYEVALEDASTAGGPRTARELMAHVAGATLELTVEDERRRALAALQRKRAGESGQGGSTTVTAPMPGRVAAVHVKPGDAVERGQPLVALEAMKMESALTAPHPGTVGEVLVQPGQTVQQRQPLLRLERGS
jgi:biotin carboxyl carrier protein